MGNPLLRSTMQTASQVSERFRLLTHEIYAEAIKRKPEIIEEAARVVRERIHQGGATFADRMWAVLLTRPAGDVLKAMLDDSEEGRTLRSGSPLSIFVGVPSPAQRDELWRKAKSWEQVSESSEFESGS